MFANIRFFFLICKIFLKGIKKRVITEDENSF